MGSVIYGRVPCSLAVFEQVGSHAQGGQDLRVLFRRPTWDQAPLGRVAATNRYCYDVLAPIRLLEDA
jgi:hypothetical protein